MFRIYRNIIDFLSVVFVAGGIGFSLLLFASEVKNAAVKKVSNGSSQLTEFTKKMTGTKKDL